DPVPAAVLAAALLAAGIGLRVRLRSADAPR
ncbi:MAG: hypothetical protein AVDCRST_MAG13-2719, partial [uncultured Solirubrobacteraceae bacterium]